MPRLVEQQHRDPVAHREGAVAGGAQQLARRLVHGQRAVVGVRAGQDRQQLRIQAQRPARRAVRGGHARTILSTWSRSSVIRASSGASTFSRSSGSVLLARRLNHAPSGSCTVSPSISSTPAPSVSAKASRTSAVFAAASATVELTSPEAAYRL